jgi:hypothetical protein
LPARISWKEQTISCKFGALVCPAVFPRTRPQPRLQHEAACRWMAVTCQWGLQDCSEETPLQDLASHLATKHGHLLRSIGQEEGKSIKLSQVKLIMTRQYNSRVFRFCRVMERQAGQIALDAAVQPSSSSGQSSSSSSVVFSHSLIITISALNNTFLLFLRTTERFREDYDIAVAMLAPPQVGLEIYFYKQFYQHFCPIIRLLTDMAMN